MIKKSLFIIVLLLQFSWQGRSQQNIKEEVFLHLSASELIVGESLYFSAFVSSQTTGKLSALSNLLYVELLDSKGDPVYQTKVELDNGRGAGTVFLSSDLETGTFQVVAYTRWMMNFDADYHQQITIVNPYKAYEQQVLTTEKSETTVSFYPEGGTILSGIENTILVHVTDQYNQGQNPKARLLSGNGEKVTDLSLDEYGLGTIHFTPVAGERYRLALESQSSFQFYDVPKACSSCSHLGLIQVLDNYQVNIDSSPDRKGKTGRLEIWSATGKAKEITTTLNTEQLISGNQLPKGRSSILLYVEGQLVNERVFHHGATKKRSTTAVQKYATREQVTQSYSIPVGTSLSVSVKKVYNENLPKGIINSNMIPDLFKTIQFAVADVDSELIDRLMMAMSSGIDTSTVDSVRYLPEHRTGIVQGRISSESKEVTPKINVALSFRGADYEIDATSVRANGEFYLKYDPAYANDKGVVRVLNDPNNDYVVEIYPEYYEKHEPIANSPLLLDSATLAQITERAIANQIENAYFEPKESESAKRIFPEIDELITYTLADYTRFPSMRDTFIELIFQVGVSKNENKFAFNMRTADIDYDDKNEVETMVLLDGAFSTAEDILKLSPYLVERIDIMNKRYFMGSVMFDGVIAIHTTDNNGGDTEPLGDKVNLISLQAPVNDLKIDNKEEVQRKPLFNDLLYWNSNTQVEEPVLDLSFYSSDLKGLYEIRMEGVTPDGEPISQSSRFEVE